MSNEPKNILVIDDDEGDRALCHRTLKAVWGDQLNFTGADNGQSGLEIIEKHSFDCLLLDQSMPGIDGIEVLERIRIRDSYLPVVMIDGKGNDVVAVRSMKAGAQDYIEKRSITPPILERAITAAIGTCATEKALRVSEERHRSIFSAVSEGIFIIDASTGTFAEANAPGAAIYGYTPDEMIGKDIQFISSGAPPYTQQDAQTLIERSSVTRRPEVFDWHARHKDGHLFWVEVSIHFATICGVEVVLSIVRDVTEQRATEGQLRQAQKMEAIGTLTGGMAHDFNNILSVIIGNLDMLREARPDDSEVRELSTDALDAAMSGAELTRRMLAFARRHPLQPQDVQLNDVVDGVVKLLRRVLGQDIAFVVHLADDIWPITADPVQLESALTNLATNARDAMTPGGQITISTSNQTLDADYAAQQPGVIPGDYASIEFTDTGSGMPPHVVARIFEPFYSTKERDRGTGLGLSMVFGFVQQSGGHIAVYSEVGIGTTFRLYFPRNMSPAARALAHSDPDEPGAPAGGETVLAVEDNVALRQVLVRQLGELGYNVVQAGGGAEALALLEAGGIDLLFTDIVMPGGMDGFELAHAAGMRWPLLKIVLTSGFPESRLRPSDALQNLRLLAKPYRKNDLARVLRETLAA